jgi:predicted nucleic acid-binding Zn ribbon protein
MESAQITVTKNGENLGPYSLDQLAVYIAEGHFGIDDLAWREGMTDWQPISKFLNVEFISELPHEILPKSEEAYPIPLVHSASNTLPKLKSLSPSDAMKTCPYCSEEVQATAKKCKHCGEFLEKALGRTTDYQWTTGRIVGLVIIVLVLVGPVIAFFLFFA